MGQKVFVIKWENSNRFELCEYFRGFFYTLYDIKICNC